MQAALTLLARRDHGREELKTKLLAKGHELQEVETVLAECELRGYLDDGRYAGQLIRSHIAKGHGPTRIRQALLQKGLSRESVETALNGCDEDWFALARTKARKKFGLAPIADAKDKARRVRYLLGQGFGFDQVAHGLEFDPYE
ncbi:regulatory protein RecX [Shewanella cyperi]|uniref:regulatory protein RecX n=1 Tax=Shewanella cyperi TaxID=2814292 RepID=UPI002B1BE59E|nr:regulatory protein RecX [Shewanella cyperi]